MSHRASGRHLSFALVSLLTLATTTRAGSFDYGFDVGVAESDNVTLVPTDKVSQTMALADVDFDFKQKTQRLDADAKGNFSYIDYLQNAFGTQLLGRFDGIARIAIVPERLTWALQDDFGQSTVDPFTPTTPNNLENVNYLSTGPDLALRLGGTGFVNMSARYARTEYETSPFNSNRLQGSLAVGLQESALSSVSLNGDTERVLFDNTVFNSDFDRTNAFVRYALQGARTDVSADVGATRIAQDGMSTTGGLLRLTVTRKLSSAASLNLSAGRVLTDASTSFSSLQSGAIGIVGTAPAAVTSDSYTSNYASLGWQYQRNRTTFSLSGRWEKDLYGGQPLLDYTRGGAEFKVARILTHAFTVEVLGRFYKTTYANPLSEVAAASAASDTAADIADIGSSNFNDEMIAATLTWHHGRALEIKLRCEHDARTITTGIDDGYRENRAVLTVGYRPRAAVQETDPGT